MDFPEKDPIYIYTHYLRSRYSETDKMGYVYYGHFLQYFEVARTEMVRALGVSYAELEERGFMLPVIHAELDYKSPVFYDEEIAIQLEVYEIPKIRLNTYYRVISTQTGEVKTLGKVVLVFMNAETRKPVKAPEYFIKSIEDAVIQQAK